MPSERFYLATSLELHKTVTFSGQEFHHLVHVMRAHRGKQIEVINGEGFLAQVLLEQIEKTTAIGYIEDVAYTPPPAYSLILAQGIPRQPRLESIIEKSVELGVTEIWLFPGRYSEKNSFSDSGKERVFSIVYSAMKQSGRLHIPKVLFLPPLEKWQLPLPPSSFFGDTQKQAPSFFSCLERQNPSSILVAIGPEKGFHPQEVLWMEEHLAMQGVRLHRHILRSDTAAFCSLSLAISFIDK